MTWLATNATVPLIPLVASVAPEADVGEPARSCCLADPRHWHREEVGHFGRRDEALAAWLGSARSPEASTQRSEEASPVTAGPGRPKQTLPCSGVGPEVKLVQLDRRENPVLEQVDEDPLISFGDRCCDD
jgi:hypothetical protein